jgi:hypothetical protein
LSLALPLTVATPETVEPLWGAENVTVGGVESRTVFFTVTETLVVAVLPAPSVALAKNLCEPSGRDDVSTTALQVVVPVAGCHAPESTETSTRLTATLSVAVPVSVTEPPPIAPTVGVARVTDGAVVSATTMFSETDVDFPDESVARADRTCVPGAS